MFEYFDQFFIEEDPIQSEYSRNFITNRLAPQNTQLENFDHQQTNEYTLNKITQVLYSNSSENESSTQKICVELTQQTSNQNLEGKKRSVFHNFQKHLITMLKATIRIEDNITEQKSTKSLATNLWRIFVNLRSAKKKYLHLVFGIAEQTDLIKQLKQAAEDCCRLKLMLRSYSLEEVVQAQQILRQQAIKQLSLLSKNQFHKKCNVNKFDQFYFYFMNFLEELEAGPIKRRMSKNRKNKVLYEIETKGDKIFDK